MSSDDSSSKNNLENVESQLETPKPMAPIPTQPTVTTLSSIPPVSQDHSQSHELNKTKPDDDKKAFTLPRLSIDSSNSSFASSYSPKLCHPVNAALSEWSTPSFSIPRSSPRNKETFDATVTDDLQDTVMKLTSEVEPWEGKLKFDFYNADPNGMISTYHKNNNILQDLELLKNIPPTVIFNPEIYSYKDGFSGDGWEDLKRDLKCAAENSGYCITANQGRKMKKSKATEVRFSCQCSIKFRGKRLDSLPNCSRKYSYNRDRQKNHREGGIKLNKKKQPFRPVDIERKCGFYFHVTITRSGFALVNGKCNTKHTNHLCIEDGSNLHKGSTLPRHVLEELKFYTDSNLQHNAISHIHYKKNKCVLTTSMIRYAVDVHGRLNDIDTLHHLNETEKMLKHFKEHGYKYTCLFERARTEKEIPTLVHGQLDPTSKDTTVDGEILTLPTIESKDAQSYLNGTRNELEVPHNYDLLVAVAWVLPDEMRQFYLCPEVVHVDTTYGTNNEGRPLLTLVGKNSLGQMFPILRAFLPNERKWVFRWIFSTVLPQMYGKDILLRVEIVMSDGDPNEQSQIDAAIDTFLKFALRLRCMWHLVVKGWEKYVPKIDADHDPQTIKAYKSLKSIVCNWIYSWSNENCATKEELAFSMKLLHKFIFSSFVSQHFTRNFQAQLSYWIKNHVEPNITRAAFYMKKCHRCFDVYTNCAQESTHHGMKFNAVPVSKSHSLTKSAIVLSSNGQKKFADTTKKYTTEMRKNNQHKDALNGSYFLLHNAEQLGQQQWGQRFNYENIRKHVSLWLVRHCVRKANQKTSIRDNQSLDEIKYFDLIPDFVHIHRVIQKDGVFFCDCEFFERWGYLCRHIANVLESFPEYDRPCNKDFSYRWQKAICYLWLCTTLSDEVRELLKDMMENDIIGPYCPPAYFENVPIATNISPDWKPNILSCTNYDVSKYMDGSDHLSVPVGMSQISNADYQHDNIFAQDSLQYQREDDDPFFEAATKHMQSISLDSNTPRESSAFALVNPLNMEIVRSLSEIKDPRAKEDTLLVLNDQIAKLKRQLVLEQGNRGTEQCDRETGTSMQNKESSSTTVRRIMSTNPSASDKRKKPTANPLASLPSHLSHRTSLSNKKSRTSTQRRYYERHQSNN